MRTIISQKDLAERWGKTTASIIRYESDGIIKRLSKFQAPHYSISAIEAIEEGGMDGTVMKYRRENEVLRERIRALEMEREAARKILGGEENERESRGKGNSDNCVYISGVVRGVFL